MSEIAWPANRGHLLESSTISLAGLGMVAHRVVLYHREHSSESYVVHYQDTGPDPGDMWQGGYFSEPGDAYAEFMRRVVRRGLARS